VENLAHTHLAAPRAEQQEVKNLARTHTHTHTHTHITHTHTSCTHTHTRTHLAGPPAEQQGVEGASPPGFHPKCALLQTGLSCLSLQPGFHFLSQPLFQFLFPPLTPSPVPSPLYCLLSPVPYSHLPSQPSPCLGFRV